MGLSPEQPQALPRKCRTHVVVTAKRYLERLHEADPASTLDLILYSPLWLRFQI